MTSALGQQQTSPRAVVDVSLGPSATQPLGSTVRRTQLVRLTNSCHLAVRAWRPLGDRRPGPLVEVNRLSDVYLLLDLEGIIDFDAQVGQFLKTYFKQGSNDL